MVFLIQMKSRFFSRICCRHSQLFSKLSDTFTLEFSLFREVNVNLLTRLGLFLKIENNYRFGTNFKLDAVTRGFYCDWFQVLG